MISRRLVMAALCAAALPLAAPATAQTDDWRRAHPELVFSVTPSENSAGILDRYAPFVAYLSRALGVKVTMRVANDYAAVIEGLRTGQVHFAHLGPAAYARAAIVTQNGVEPLVTMANSQGAIGYYSVLYVRAGDPAQNLADLKGRNLCLVDPNSASGNNVPRFAMSKLGIERKPISARSSIPAATRTPSSASRRVPATPPSTGGTRSGSRTSCAWPPRTWRAPRTSASSSSRTSSPARRSP